MYDLVQNPWIYSSYVSIFFLLVLLYAFLKRYKALRISLFLYITTGIMLIFLKQNSGIVLLGYLAVLLPPFIFIWLSTVYNKNKKILTEKTSLASKEHSELVSEEGVIYDAQLKLEERLSQMSSLYEITKDMSTSLHFIDIFKILTEYMQKIFLFKNAKLILIDANDGTSSKNVVFETSGVQDAAVKAKGIFPKLDISTRLPNEHDKKIYTILKSSVKRLQIAKTDWEQNPYTHLLPKDVQTYMAVPMIFDDKPIGILAIEDLPARDFEKFSILAAQFTLEMRRIVLYERVEEMAITDGLTKAFTKRYMMERLSEEFERSARHNFDLSFVMADIDHFKSYNDTYGHLVGDVVLRDIVDLLKSNTREVDLVGRFGGEEFCIILPETKKQDALLVSERIREMVQQRRFKAYDELTDVTLSMGIASYPEDCKKVSDLIEKSDSALYTAKNTGRNRVCTYTSKA